MKKIIALALALVLSLSMATVAFAADRVVKPGDDITCNAWEFVSIDAEGKVVATLASKFDASDRDEAKKYFSDENFSIKYKVSKGKDLIESVKFDDGIIKITLKSSDLEAPAIPNFKVDEFYVQAKKDIDDVTGSTRLPKAVKRNDKFYMDFAQAATGSPAVLSAMGTVGFDANSIIDKTAGDQIDLAKGANLVKINKTEPYGTSEFDFAGLATAEVKVFEKDKFYFTVNEDFNLAVYKLNSDIDQRFVNLKGNFNGRTATFWLYAEEDEYVYVLKDGKLAPADLKWDDEVGAWKGKVSTLGTYVIAESKLTNLVVDKDATDDTKNPNTGANDFVGVAVALAVVSLVAAGAVSLKK